MAEDPQAREAWQKVAAQLRACREAQQRSWGTLDDITLGRYVAGDASPEERKQIEAALTAYPELRLLTEVVRDVTVETDTAVQAATPIVLPLRSVVAARPRRRFIRRHAPLLVAACLLLALGVPFFRSIQQDQHEAPEVIMAAKPHHPNDLPDERDEIAATDVEPARHPDGRSATTNEPSSSAQPRPIEDEATALVSQIGMVARQSPARIKATAVPVLERGLRQATTPSQRQTFARALGQLGPAARAAIPTLAECLKNAGEPEERCAVVDALGAMGPVAREAQPILVEALKVPCERTRECAVQALRDHGPEGQRLLRDIERRADRSLRKLLSRVHEPERVFGIRDDAELFSPAAAAETMAVMRRLARRFATEAFVETSAAVPDANANARRAGELGINGILLQINAQPPGLHIAVCDTLRHHGFALEHESRLRTTGENLLRRKDYDGCLRESIRFVSQFEREHDPSGIVVGPTIRFSSPELFFRAKAVQRALRRADQHSMRHHGG